MRTLNSVLGGVAILFCSTLVGLAQSKQLLQPAAGRLPASPAQTLLSVESAASQLPVGQLKGPYSAKLQMADKRTVYQWRITSGHLPAGLTLKADGSIVGTPVTPGRSSFTVGAKAVGLPGGSTISKNCIIVIPSELVIATQDLASGMLSQGYAQQLQVDGGLPSYSWGMMSGALPSGLTLTQQGMISGMPTVSGTFTFSIAVLDSEPGTHQVAQSYTLSIGAPIAVTTNLLPDGEASKAYSAIMVASGGTPPYKWSLASGTLPAGLALAKMTGAITGTPSSAGSANLVLSVSDMNHTSASKSIQILVAPTLAITTTVLPAAKVGAAYSSAVQAVGGIPAYTWSIQSGTLPAGLSLNATTGAVTGVPLQSSSSTFTLGVQDAALPGDLATQVFSVVVTNPAPQVGTTWYVRADGGSRYSVNNQLGQCDGKGDAPYGGTGTNQHCAFGDYRLLYDDQHTYGAPNLTSWAISGGDTVIIDNTKQWRVGHDQGISSNDAWCPGTGNSVCFNPTIPAGTAAQHTRILGRNYAACSTSANRGDHSLMTQLFGGFGVYQTLNLTNTQYVDVQCLEVSSYTNCIVHGSPNPNPCSTNFPLSDYAQDGVEINSNTANVQFQDMYIHSVAAYGIHGNVANPVTFNRVDVAYTGATGVNLDDGTEADSPNGSFTFNYGSIKFAGCAPEYPAVHAIPVTYCFDQNSANNGDGLGTANVSGLDMHFDHDVFAYNTEDCIDPGHVYSGTHTLTLTNNVAYGCQGATFKWGANFTNATIQNNLSIANCARMSMPLAGAPATYNQYLSLFCRAGDATSFNFLNGGTGLVENNTFVGTASIMFDINCVDTSCATSTFTFRNNIIRAYADTTIYASYNGGAGPAGLAYSGPSLGKIVEDHNVFFGPMRNQPCPPGGLAESCADPMFVNEPPTFVNETTLDNFTATLTSASPARYAGQAVPGLLLDLTGAPYAVVPSMGAIEYGSSYVIQ